LPTVAYVLPLEGFTPGSRSNNTPWTQARIEEAPAHDGPWSPLATFNLSPLDSDPQHPQERDFQTTTPNARGWYRVVWLDAAGDRQDTPGIYSDQSRYETTGVPFRDLVARLRALSAMTVAEAEARINQAHRRWVADCEAIKVKLDIGPTVAGQDTYTLESRVVSLHSLRVNGYRYERKSIDEVEDLGAHDAYVVGRYRGFFAQEFTEGAVSEIVISPTPAQGDLAITGRASVLPADMTADTDYPDLPPDFHEDLIEDAFATTLRRDDERIGDAQSIDAQTAARKKELTARLTHRVGRGIARIKLLR
jgi:hypothetical protein